MWRARKMAERLKIVKDDPWLEPVEGELEYRRKLYLDALKEIEEASESIADYADGYLYFGFQRDEERTDGGSASGCRGMGGVSVR